MKRSASETLLPLRSAKVPRISMEHRNGGNATPSEANGILLRWKTLVWEGLSLTRDTFFAFLGGPRDSRQHPATHLPPSSQHLPPQTKSTRNQRNRSPPHRHPSPQSSHLPLPPPQSAQLNPVPSTSMRQVTEELQTGLPSPPSTHTATVSSSPSASLIGSHPQLDDELKKLKSRQDNAAARRRGKTREHIHAEAHKKKLAQIRKQDLENMQKELYEMHRKRGASPYLSSVNAQLMNSPALLSGYASDFADFQGFLKFRQALERLQNLEVLATSRSLSDLRERAEADERARRHSHEDYSRTWMKRALAHAKASIESPKPFRPSTSFFDQLQQSQLAKDQEIEGRLRPKHKPLPDHLPPEDEDQVDILFSKKGVISKCVREQVTDRDLSRLRPHQWLNDEVINFYGQMILSRSEANKENPPANGAVNGRKGPLKVHYFNTFFWTKMKGDGYEKSRLAKWTKKIDIFSKDIILIPVNHNNSHWTSAAINFRKKRIESYDSMGMDRSNVFKVLRQYLDAEHRNKKKKPFDFTGWVDYTLEDTPQQENGYDCGVFTCQTLESISRGEESFAFQQSNMPYLRRRMVWEIGHAKLWEDA